MWCVTVHDMLGVLIVGLHGNRVCLLASTIGTAIWRTADCLRNELKFNYYPVCTMAYDATPAMAYHVWRLFSQMQEQRPELVSR